VVHRHRDTERHPAQEAAQEMPLPRDERGVNVEQEIVVRLFPQGFHWVEVDAEYLGPARPRIPHELAGVDE
jgi:hypothetical protein